MRRYNNPRKITPTIIVFIFTLIAFLFLVYRIVFISVPPKYIEIKCNISAETNIYTNTLGISHIISVDDEAMFFAFGYITARDRLWSIVKTRIISQGRMSEYFGDDYIDIDIFMRCFYLDDIANKCYENADDYTKNVLKHYADGINQFLNDNKGKLPIEFSATGLVPELWQPKDCFLMLRYWSFILSNNIYSDIITSNIVNKLGLKALELFPKYPKNSPHILDDIVFPIKKDTVRLVDTTIIDSISIMTMNSVDTIAKHRHILKQSIPDNELLRTEVLAMMNIKKINNSKNISPLAKLYDIIGRQGSNLGCNTWAVTSTDGSSVLAHDSHFPINLASAWMQIHLSSPSYNIVGVCLPGIPIILTGRNDYISWGNANMLIDDIDYFVHKFKDEKQTEYLHNETIYKSVISIIDTIKVKGQKDSLYYKNIIDGCPMLSDIDVNYLINCNVGLKKSHSEFVSKFSNFNKEMQKQVQSDRLEVRNYLTYKWTGSTISNEIGAILKVMKADNWNEFLIGINDWNTPGMVFSFADIRGNIGIAPRGLIPTRAKDLAPQIVNPYWKYEIHWQGFTKPSQIPVSYNPIKKFVVATNNAVLRDTTKYISSIFALDSRVKRFYELSNNIAEYNYRDAQITQKDITSIYAKDLMKKLEYIFRKYKHLLNEIENKAYTKLANWDYSLLTNSTASSIFNMFLRKMIENTFADELGDLYESYVYNPNIPMQKLLQLCSTEPNSEWFDNIKTADKIEQLNYITITSFKDAINELINIYGTNNLDKWQYGKFHTVKLNHNFSYYPTINPIIDKGIYSIGGGISTINCAEWDILNPFDVILITTMRFITDMNSDNCYTAILGGISGDPMNSHYANQINFFNIGAYSTLSINRTLDEKFNLIIKLNKN